MPLGLTWPSERRAEQSSVVRQRRRRTGDNAPASGRQGGYSYSLIILQVLSMLLAAVVLARKVTDIVWSVGRLKFEEGGKTDITPAVLLGHSSVCHPC